MKKTAERIVWLDAVKGLVALTVVLGHICLYYYDAQAFPLQSGILLAISRVIYSFHMPLCLTASGIAFGLAYTRADGTLKFGRIKFQIANLLIIYVLWSFFYVLAEQLFASHLHTALSFSDLLWIPLRAVVQPYWYIYILILCYCLTILLWKRPPVFTLITVSICFYLLWSKDFLPESTVFELYPSFLFFSFGLALQQYRRLRELLCRSWMLLLLFALRIIMMGYEVYVEPGATLNWMAISLPGVLSELVISAALVGLFIRLSEKNLLHLLPWTGRYVLEIYVSHSFILTAVRILLPRLGVPGCAIHVGINFLFSVGTPIAASLVLRRIGLHDLFFRPMALWQKHRSRGEKPGQKPEDAPNPGK